MTINNLQDTPVISQNEVVNSILQNPEIRRNFLCMALFEELARNPNPNIANLFVFIQKFESVYIQLSQADEKYWNRLIRDMRFDGKRFSDFFISLYESDIYGVGFLEDTDKKEIILDIVEDKEGKSLHLSGKLESMLDVYVFEECEEKGMVDPDKLALFRAIRHDERIGEAIKCRLFTQSKELRKSLHQKLLQKAPEIKGGVQNQVAQVVTGENKDS